MKKYYVSGKVANLDVGSEIEAKNKYQAAIEFHKLYSEIEDCFLDELEITEVEEVRRFG